MNHFGTKYTWFENGSASLIFLTGFGLKSSGGLSSGAFEVKSNVDKFVRFMDLTVAGWDGWWVGGEGSGRMEVGQRECDHLRLLASLGNGVESRCAILSGGGLMGG